MQNTETKTNNSVKSKLVAAIAMLLVATIMVVSSTYAWFTLSTKPEVTGISTAVGANGALEMLLATKDGAGWVYHDGVVDTNATWKERNTYWGNLVNLSDLYGSEMITLYPSKLNVTNSGFISETPISFPEYGADGRVNALQPGGEFGTYDGESKNFFANSDFGFRALGMTSGMTARQQSFKVALAQVAINQSTAKSEARESLAANGTQLAAIAVKKGMGTSTEYDAKDSAAVKAMVEGIEKSLTALETAYLEALYTAVYSNLNDTENDAEVTLQISAIDAAANGKPLGEKIAAAITAVGDSTISDKLEGYSDFVAAVADFNTAKPAIEALGVTGDLATLIAALSPLVDVTAVTVNDYKPSEVKDHVSDIITNISNGIKVHIGDDGGVYGTIAKLCGQYNASIKIDLSVIDDSFTEGSFPADMTVGDNQQGTLNAVRTVLNGLPPTDAGATNPISEFYGYVIDLAFRTNAANSNLLLQTAAADRIYGDNQNEETLGKGSTMTFNTDFALFSEDQMKKLMGNITLVFFQPDHSEGMKIIKYAKLDADNAKKVDDGLEANIYLLDDTKNFITVQDDAVIQAMNTNQPTHVSVLVYLDGETLTNADVAATLAESMSGKLNLQFASSAELAPMDYADLHHKTTTENNGGNAQG